MMSRKQDKHLMRQQSTATIHESYWVELWRGGGGLSLSVSSNPPTGRASQNFS